MRRIVGLVLVAAAVATGAHGSQAQGTTGLILEQREIVITAEDVALVVQRRVALVHQTAEQVARAVARPLPAAASAWQIRRLAPLQQTDYLLGVTREGSLVVGEQVRVYDARRREYGPVRGDLGRTYQPLDGQTPWAWLVDVPVSRDVNVTLEIQAVGSWPVETVAITPVNLP